MGLDRELADILEAAQAAVCTPEREEAIAEERRRAEAAEARRRRHRALRGLDASGLRLHEGDAARVIDGQLRPTKALRAVQRWLDEGRQRPPVLVLCGAVGVGKTVAAALAVHRMDGEAVYAPRLPERVDPWRAEIEQGWEPLPLQVPGLIVLDDLGVEADPENARWSEAFAEFVDVRQGRGSTLITSNLSRHSFRKRYGDRIADRLNHCARVVEIAGASMRRKGAL